MFGFSTSSGPPSPKTFSIVTSSSTTNESLPSFARYSAQAERWRGTSQNEPSRHSCQQTVTYGDPSGLRHAIFIGLPRARNASISSGVIPRTFPRQPVSGISGLLPMGAYGLPSERADYSGRRADDCDQADRASTVRRLALARPVLAHPRARRARDDDGRSAPALLRRVERSDPSIHRRRRNPGAARRPYVLLRER